MNLSTTLALTGGIIVLLLVALRVERAWRWAVVLLAAPIGYLLWDWAKAQQAWLEVGVSVGAAFIITFVWWLAYGRKLPPTQSTIRVWGQDAAPKPKAAELQAEVNRLREEKEQLEAELQKLRENQKTETE